jgi:outer membrane protein assembly factor BamA
LRKLATVLLIIAASAASFTPATAQEQRPAGVLPDDDPQRPQPPDGFQVERKKKGGLLYAAGKYVDDHCGNIVVGFGIAACFPRYWEPTANFNGRSSLSLGLNVHNDRLRSQGLQFGVTSSASILRYQRYTGYLGWNDPVKDPYVRVTGFYDIQTQEQFWGLGPDSDEDDRTTYGWERMGAEAKIGVPANRRISGHAGVRYEESVIYGGRDGSDPMIGELFGPEEAPGFQVNRQEYVVPNAMLVIDLTRNPGGRPTFGARVKGWWEMYSTQNDLPFEWTTVGGEASLHLGTEFHTLSFLVGAEEADPDGSDDQVLFAYQPSLGGSRTLRGFSSHRFRDLAAGWGAVAYRWALWRARTDDPHTPAAAIEAQIFYDFGGVDDKVSDVDFTEFDSYGFEIRGYSVAGHLLGIGIARGDEGVSLNFSVMDVF